MPLDTLEAPLRLDEATIARDATPPLHRIIEDALQRPGDPPLWVSRHEPADEYDLLASLCDVQQIWLGPPDFGEAPGHQFRPWLIDMKRRLEARFQHTLGDGRERGGDDRVDTSTTEPDHPQAVVAAMRRLAGRDLVPAIYRWLSQDADRCQLARFLAVEGGPDAGFDDLVAVAQVGLGGSPKVTLGSNYWDEMGRGALDRVHTELYRRMVHAVDMGHHEPPRLPASALRRSVLSGYLAVNRSLQPELIGALGLLELQAGPRCRQVVRAMERVGASEDAIDFYQEHALADPVHGKEWLDGAVGPLVESDPRWAARILRGARWRASVNLRFFNDPEVRRFVVDGSS